MDVSRGMCQKEFMAFKECVTASYILRLMSMTSELSSYGPAHRIDFNNSFFVQRSTEIDGTQVVDVTEECALQHIRTQL